MAIQEHPNAEAFRQARDGLSAAVADLAVEVAAPAPAQPRTNTMRGLQRLAHLTTTTLADMDAKADAVCDRIVAGQARAEVVISKFGAVADSIEQTANDVEAALGQISNDPTQVSGA